MQYKMYVCGGFISFVHLQYTYMYMYSYSYVSNYFLNT